MSKEFNITGTCYPEMHYMVNLDSRIAQIKKMIDNGKYFAINKGRQYGKTTILKELKKYLNADYIVVSLDFQAISTAEFRTEELFTKALARELYRLKSVREVMNSTIRDKLNVIKSFHNQYVFADLFNLLEDWCEEAEKPIVLLIDEIDSASNNQIFLDFLSQLRWYYLNRDERATFRSVILAGVHDVRNLKNKIRPDSEHRHNSPWNIAVPFDVDMSFSSEDITGMLKEYEADYCTGMNISEMAQMIYDATSGYPVLVSYLCKLMDEKIAGTELFPDKSYAWTKEGFLKAEKILLSEKTPLFDSLINKLKDYETLKKLLHQILFSGKKIPYNADNDAIDIATMYSFVANKNGQLTVFNRIFETRIYDWFMSEEETNGNDFYSKDKSQFIQNGKLNMELVLEKFTLHFNDVYGSKDDRFKEEVGRRLFLLYLKPIINGTGTYYIEAQTRNERRMDVVVNYAGEEFIIELKIWHGEKYNADGEQQVSDYLDYKHHTKG
ncbi:MAG: ATP-binding protein, partial [Oscillospiraceae bacterium]